MGAQRRSEYVYRMVQIPPNVEIKSEGDRGHAAELYLNKLTAQMGYEGWDFYRIDTIGVVERPGCLGGLLQFQPIVTQYYVVTFRKRRIETEPMQSGE